MRSTPRKLLLLAALLAGAICLSLAPGGAPRCPSDRTEVVFWHFWGGKEREVVEQIVARFNAQSPRYWVRAVAMPGNNLDLKFFLSVAGQAPPDLLNQDDPVVADWAARGAIQPVADYASPAEEAALRAWLFPAARELGAYEGRLYAVCNGLDVRALYFDRTLLEQHGLTPPQTLAELDAVAAALTDPPEARRRFGFLPDPRRLWAWGSVFGGEFLDPATGEVRLTDERIVAALEWMAGYSRRYGADEVAAFRQKDQATAGAAFPLLQGRYALLMDGQWRVAEIAAARAAALARGETPHEFGVVPLPAPPDGRTDAGWVNGNFFVVPHGAQQPQGAWEFIRFWTGYGGHEAQAARICIEGGWIPAGPAVVQEPAFAAYLAAQEDFAEFVRLAGSPTQRPTPNLPGAALLYAEVVRAAEEALYAGRPPREALAAAEGRLRQQLAEIAARLPAGKGDD